jgi:hypothetical protein
VGMGWLSGGDVVAQLWGCGGPRRGCGGSVVGMWWLSWLRRDWVNQTATQQFPVRSQLPPQSPEGWQEL